MLLQVCSLADALNSRDEELEGAFKLGDRLPGETFQPFTNVGAALGIHLVNQISLTSVKKRTDQAAAG